MYSIKYAIREPWNIIFGKSIEKFNTSNNSINFIDISKVRKIPNPFASFGSFLIFNQDDTLQLALADISTSRWFLQSKFYLAGCIQLQNKFITPRSIDIRWDIDTEALDSRIETFLTTYPGPYVLKRDGGSGGRDIYFIDSKDQLLNEIETAREMENAMPFLEERNATGSVANWSLQEYIQDLMLLTYQNALHKFTLRCFIVEIGSAFYLHRDVEVRLASEPVLSSAFSTDNIDGHLTNGTQGAMRFLATEFEELNFVQDVVETFVHEIFATQTMEDVINQEQATYRGIDWKIMGVYAIDIMCDIHNHLWLLEVNHSPSAPEPASINLKECSVKFMKHLDQFCIDFMQLIVSSETIIENHGKENDSKIFENQSWKCIA